MSPRRVGTPSPHRPSPACVVFINVLSARSGRWRYNSSLLGFIHSFIAVTECESCSRRRAPESQLVQKTTQFRCQLYSSALRRMGTACCCQRRAAAKRRSLRRAQSRDVRRWMRRVVFPAQRVEWDIKIEAPRDIMIDMS